MYVERCTFALRDAIEDTRVVYVTWLSNFTVFTTQSFLVIYFTNSTSTINIKVSTSIIDQFADIK